MVLWYLMETGVCDEDSVVVHFSEYCLQLTLSMMYNTMKCIFWNMQKRTHHAYRHPRQVLF